MKKIAALVALAVLGLGVAWTAPASATENPGVCVGLDSGKIDVSEDIKTITVSAPEGYLIDGYCVKAGSIQQGLGPEYVDVDPPVASVTISHSTGKDISHYSVSYVLKPSGTPTPRETTESPTPTPTETTATPTPTETTSTPTPTESTPTSTPTSSTPSGCIGDGCEELPRTGGEVWLAGLGALLLAAGAAALALTRRTGSHA
jgi:hypothetical protein